VDHLKFALEFGIAVVDMDVVDRVGGDAQGLEEDEIGAGSEGC
jgi:hypothetical protein